MVAIIFYNPVVQKIKLYWFFRFKEDSEERQIGIFLCIDENDFLVVDDHFQRDTEGHIDWHAVQTIEFSPQCMET